MQVLHHNHVACLRHRDDIWQARLHLKHPEFMGLSMRCRLNLPLEADTATLAQWAGICWFMVKVLNALHRNGNAGALVDLL